MEHKITQKIAQMIVMLLNCLPAAEPPCRVVPRAGGAVRRAEFVGELSLGAEFAEAICGLPVHPGWAGDALAVVAGLPPGSTISV